MVLVLLLRDRCVEILNNSVPWFWGKILPKYGVSKTLTPKDILIEIKRNNPFIIANSVVQNYADVPNRRFGPSVAYTVIPVGAGSVMETMSLGGRIKYPTKGIVFLYTIEKQP